ncbi:MAG: alpha/beta fold hydrolase [Candidatus Sericytochromatia bacterium]|nr:alpha/beta fold hydrolase [Candidatus Sericytochromatia bacterium]
MNGVERITVDGLEIAYTASGQGPVLLLLHAFPLNQRMWDPQLEGLADHAHVVTLDLPGFGSSQTTDGEMTVDGLADVVHHAMEALGHGRYVVGGLSMGGYVALALARRHPEALRGLVLADTRAAADSAEVRAGREALAQRVTEEGVEDLAASFPGRAMAAATRVERPALVATVVEWARAVRPPVAAGALRMMASRPDATPLLPHLAMPVLAVVGEGDALTPPEEMEGLAAAVPLGTISRLPAAGHLSNLEQPEAFNQAVGAFLEALPP